MFFIRPNQKNPVYLLIYVDDLGIVRDRSGTDTIKSELSKVFTAQDLGSCTHFLGIKVQRFWTGFFLTKAVYGESDSSSWTELSKTSLLTPTSVTSTLR